MPECVNNAIDLGAEDGFVKVKFGDHEVTLDLIETWDRYAQHCDENQDRPDFLATVVELAQSLGLPNVSQRVALRFFRQVAELVAKVKKNDHAAAYPGATSPEPLATTDSMSAT